METFKTMETFKDKQVVITGAGRSLGAALAIVLADARANVILLGRTPETLSATANAILSRTGKPPLIFHADMADKASVEQAAKDILEQTSVDILINNAAFWLAGGIHEVSSSDVFQTINSMLTGTILLTKALLPSLLKVDSDIVNIVSISGLPNVALYGASSAFLAAKHGQTGFTDGLRQELKGTSVRVIGIYPPLIEDISPLDKAWQEVRDKSQSINNRDVAETILFALTRPRNCTLASVALDADAGGLHSHDWS
jgi:NADP-dependent 3-hydroxy acid dehydrogenase YdfG